MSEKMDKLVKLGSEVVMNTYTRYPVALDHGEGAYMWDIDGKKYVDCVGGIAVNSLGCNNEKLVKKISEQAAKLIHCSNLYYTEPQIQLANMLVKNSDFDKVFFCNSGAEANEAALKLCRKYAKLKNKKGSDIITMIKSFHGRTYGAVTATGQDKYHKGLDPLLPGIKYAEYNNIESLKAVVDENTCAIMMEVIQGEGGIIPADKKYLEEVRKLCDENDILLVFDEVQTGVGRSGELFAYQAYGVAPDIATLAKGLAGGVPIGAMLATDNAAKGFNPGDHASTFGGNSLATAAGTVVIDELLNNGLLDNVKKQGVYLTEKLNGLKDKYSIIKDVRGMGLMQGIQITVPVGEVVKKCIENGLLVVGAGADVVRFVPPLIISSVEIDEAINIIDKVLSEF